MSTFKPRCALARDLLFCGQQAAGSSWGMCKPQLSEEGKGKLCLPAQASVRPLLGCSGGAAAPKPLPLSTALCARTTPPAAAVSAAAPNTATDVPPEQLWVPPMQPRDSFTAASDFYPYARPPPPGFQRWLEYAQPRECLLGRYDRMEADLAPFRYAHHDIQRNW